MQFEGTYILDGTPSEVWSALNSEEVLARCIPGCESVDYNGDGSYAAVVALRIGPVRARFHSHVEIEEVVPLRSYRISGNGKGGVAGFARGEAELNLVPEPDATRLNYVVDAKIGGKIAQLGSRMLTATVRKLSDKFFENLALYLGEKRSV